MAAPILSFEGLGVNQGTGWLFRDLDITIGQRDRLALIGRNGVGKTTLLKLLAGVIEPDAGRRSVVPGTRIAMLEQDPDLRGHATLRDYATAGADAPARHEVEAIADQIGIDLNRTSASASGGERRRAALARTLAGEPDLLFLDEPTNHLDIAAIDWLENWLGRYNGAFVTISHDRTFLTRLTRQTLWLDRGLIRRNEIGFGGFDAWMEKVYADEARNAEKLDAKLKIEAHWLERGVTARRKRNQGRLSKLYEMRAERAAMVGPQGTAKLAMASDGSKTKSVIVADKVTKGFPQTSPSQTPFASSEVGKPRPGASTTLDTNGGGEMGSETESGPVPVRAIIRDFSIRIQRGDRIGLVGGNGAGKTTLLKLLTGELEPDDGTITLSRTLDMIFIDQQRSLMAPTKSVRDVLAEGGDWIDVRGTRKHVHGYLKEFLFDPALAEAKVGTLSGGERSRLLFAREFARPSNLLVLDEPTNDLDLETMDLLQEVIADYDGTVLIVSHDRDFLDKTVTVTLGLDGSGHVDVVVGGYADWVKQRANRVNQASGAKKAGATASPAAPQKSGAKLTYKDQRDLDLLPKRVEELEAQIARDEAAMAAPDLYTRQPAKFDALMKAVAAARAEKDAAEERWLELAEKAEALGG